MKPALLDVVLMSAGESPCGSVVRVERTGTEVAIRHAKEGEFKYWERKHGGCFRRYPRERALWSRNDERKFEFIERERHSTFFVVVEENEMKVYPERHLCL